MKHLHRFGTLPPYIFLLFISFFLLTSCFDVEDGEIGPQGAQGETGSKGEAGDTGDQGLGVGVQSGYFKGTLKGVRKDKTEFEETFEYTYAQNDFDLISGHEIRLQRVATPADLYSENLNMTINADIDLEKGELTFPYVDFTYAKEITPSSIFYLYLSTSQIETSNFNFNASDSTLSFDFTVDFDPNESGYSTNNRPLLIEGSFFSGGKIRISDNQEL
ncbi:hypothetical protein [Fulvivirga ligni]|uniref:hypothetical protein n=1 Tax=Fulvivirga ligni TaxID=2904246 RepID=UPI001F1B9CB3|nr:hypothetical protein [Fulvivirga ligni]UII20742.1 hypothetical protein LVD16_23145 [Fulvivirga ligni]